MRTLMPALLATTMLSHPEADDLPQITKEDLECHSTLTEQSIKQMLDQDVKEGTFAVQKNDTSGKIIVDFEALHSSGPRARNLSPDDKLVLMFKARERLLKELPDRAVRYLDYTRHQGGENQFYKDGAYKPYPKIIVHPDGGFAFDPEAQQAGTEQTNERLDNLESYVKEGFTKLFEKLGVEDPPEKQTEETTTEEDDIGDFLDGDEGTEEVEVVVE